MIRRKIKRWIASRKPSQFAYYGVVGSCTFLVALNAVELATKDYCIHDVELSIYALIAIVIFTAASYVCKWFEIKKQKRWEIEDAPLRNTQG